MCLKKKVKYVETYRGWLIAEFREAFEQRPSGKRISLYVAVNPFQHVFTGVDLPDLKGDIDEALR